MYRSLFPQNHKAIFFLDDAIFLYLRLTKKKKKHICDDGVSVVGR